MRGKLFKHFANPIDKQYRYESKPFVLTKRISKNAAAKNKIVGKQNFFGKIY